MIWVYEEFSLVSFPITQMIDEIEDEERVWI